MSSVRARTRCGIVRGAFLVDAVRCRCYMYASSCSVRGCSFKVTGRGLGLRNEIVVAQCFSIGIYVCLKIIKNFRCYFFKVFFNVILMKIQTIFMAVNQEIAIM